MINEIKMHHPEWKGYELIDCGGFEKLERFGKYILSRPEPQAIWEKSLPVSEWNSRANAQFKKDKNNPEKGIWNVKNMPDKWQMSYEGETIQLQFKLSLTSFKHVGIFPEQAVNWNFIFETICSFKNPGKVLNLFAYTGGASLAASKAGAEVVHVDAVKNVVNWGHENATLNDLDKIFWIVEDAVKFVKREIRRGKKYQGIILDPPAYGRGPDGEKWVLEDQLYELMKDTLQLLDEEEHFYLLNLYSMGLSPIIPATALQQIKNSPNSNKVELGELIVIDSFNKKLPLGTFLRFKS